jgi:hypothetical protein
MIAFCFDSPGDFGLGYPNLAKPNLDQDQFDHTYPRTLPLRLLMYLEQRSINFSVHTVTDAPLGAWYPVAWGWHDFECDYFSLMSDLVKKRLRDQEIRVLFYYHEGDHPGRIQQRLDQLCQLHDVPVACYLFVSANSACKNWPRCRYFNDHEYFFSYINRFQKAPIPNQDIRPYEFTALNRVHKWWRASVMADLYHSDLLDKSLWSYNTECTIDDQELNNPIELDSVLGWRHCVSDFIKGGPYICDHGDRRAHNDHRRVNIDLYRDSYCHLVIETLFDVDGSGGAFLTEKTFKCIKFGQPFVMIGPVGSLGVLRQQGYRVFDHAMDNSYDLIGNNTERWMAVKKTIQEISKQDMYQWFLSCRDDVLHNQRIFAGMTHQSLQHLAADLDTV